MVINFRIFLSVFLAPLNFFLLLRKRVSRLAYLKNSTCCIFFNLLAILAVDKHRASPPLRQSHYRFAGFPRDPLPCFFAIPFTIFGQARFALTRVLATFLSPIPLPPLKSAFERTRPAPGTNAAIA